MTTAATAPSGSPTIGLARYAGRLAPARRYLVPLGLVATWQIGSSAGLIPARTVASPATILQTFADLTLSGELPKIALGALGSSFPIYLTLSAGFRGVDAKLVEAGRTPGLSQRRLIRHV